MNAEEKKRILLVVGAYPPAYGGAGLRVHRIYKRLKEILPIEVWVITASRPDQPPGWSRFEGVPVYTVPNASSWRTCIGVLQFCRSHTLTSYHLVHGLGMSRVSRLVCTLAWFLGIPVIREITLGKGPRRERVWKHVLRRLAFVKAELVIAMSEAVRRRCIAYGVNKERIWKRPNPIDTRFFKPPVESERLLARKKLSLTTNATVLLVLGRMQPRKNQMLAVEVLNRLSEDHHLILAGPVFKEDDAYLKAVKLEIVRLGLSSRVLLLPEHIEDIIRLYHAADCILIPSTDEGLPNVMLEALSCGVPAVVSGKLDLNDYIKDGFNGFNVEPTPDGFANGVIQLKSITVDWKARVDIAREAESCFDSERLNKEFAVHLVKVLDSKYKGSPIESSLQSGR